MRVWALLVFLFIFWLCAYSQSNTEWKVSPQVVEERIKALNALTPMELVYNKDVQAYIDVYTIRRAFAAIHSQRLSPHNRICSIAAEGRGIVVFATTKAGTGRNHDVFEKTLARVRRRAPHWTHIGKSRGARSRR